MDKLDRSYSFSHILIWSKLCEIILMHYIDYLQNNCIPLKKLQKTKKKKHTKTTKKTRTILYVKNCKPIFSYTHDPTPCTNDHTRYTHYLTRFSHQHLLLFKIDVRFHWSGITCFELDQQQVHSLYMLFS